MGNDAVEDIILKLSPSKKKSKQCSILEETKKQAEILSKQYAPYNINYVMHKENRQRIVNELKNTYNINKGILIILGGEDKPNYCTDTESVFRQESFFQHLFGARDSHIVGITCNSKDRTTR